MLETLLDTVLSHAHLFNDDNPVIQQLAFQHRMHVTQENLEMWVAITIRNNNSHLRHNTTIIIRDKNGAANVVSTILGEKTCTIPNRFYQVSKHTRKNCQNLLI